MKGLVSMARKGLGAGTWAVTVAVAAAVSLTLALGACSSDEEADAGASSDATANGDGVVTTFPQPVLGGPCVSSDDCPSAWCDKRYGKCVDCFTTRHCADDEVCSYGSCVEPEGCGAGACPYGVCTVDNVCIDCVDDAGCAPGLACVDNVCRPPATGCADSSECAATGAVCLPSGECGDCLDDTGCGDFEVCSEGACVPKPCLPAQASCVGDIVQVCRRDGKGFEQIQCGEGQTCFAGECILDECEPNTTRCDKYVLKQCSADGKLLTKACPPGQECLNDECAPMRHRALVVFDTSNSMNWYPGIDDRLPMCGAGQTEECLQPWPSCESCTEPLTRLGRSKAVFKEFFQNSTSDEVLFALQRFPQTVEGTNATCEGGYMAFANAMTGDDGGFWSAFDVPNYLDENIGEAVIVDFPPTLEDTNLYDLVRWVDCREEVDKSNQACVQHSDCPGGFCKGAAGQKVCRFWTNPEIRADGWTPLGQSLFYSGEYLRRHVVIDGKACASDAECASPGYYCSQGGKCFDPLRECRLNVIVLFTDGVDTVNDLENDFFNPIVQAKRLRFGLGCTTDEDCSQRAQCIESEDSARDGCHDNRCHADGYCTNDLHQLDQNVPVKLGLSAAHVNRLLDRNNNPVEVITHVVDGSGPDSENNRRIALNGGGLHVTVNVEDAPDFLNKLKKTVDFKSLFRECSPTDPDR